MMTYKKLLCGLTNGLLILIHLKQSMLTSQEKKLQFPELQFGIQGPKIFQSLSHTHLGIHFQSDGHWNKHMHKIHDKAAKRLNLLRMLKYKINRKSLVTIYNAWIRPILEYIVWDNCSIKDSKILEDLQVEAARIITGLRHNSSRSKLNNGS